MKGASMTENEAIKCLEKQIEIQPCMNVISAFEIAIQALEEIQQYRELGTVEEILKVFNNQRTIMATQHETLKQYRAIGTIEEFKALKEKETEVLLKDGQLLYQQGLVDGYAKAIDEFAERLKEEISYRYGTGEINCAYNAEEKTIKIINQVSEQLKAGGE